MLYIGVVANEFEKSNGNNDDLQNFADTTLPKLQMHLDSANSIASHY